MRGFDITSIYFMVGALFIDIFSLNNESLKEFGICARLIGFLRRSVVPLSLLALKVTSRGCKVRCVHSRFLGTS